ncbi:hypothetical protein SUDANB19_06636 (plasmid) [Streptomyces sp. enrichment culture]
MLAGGLRLLVLVFVGRPALPGGFGQLAGVAAESLQAGPQAVDSGLQDAGADQAGDLRGVPAAAGEAQ